MGLGILKFLELFLLTLALAAGEDLLERAWGYSPLYLPARLPSYSPPDPCDSLGDVGPIPPDVVVEIKDSRDSVPLGQTFDYCFTVTNIRWPSESAQDVRLAITFDSRLEFEYMDPRCHAETPGVYGNSGTSGTKRNIPIMPSPKPHGNPNGDMFVCYLGTIACRSSQTVSVTVNTPSAYQDPPDPNATPGLYWTFATVSAANEGMYANKNNKACETTAIFTPGQTQV